MPDDMRSPPDDVLVPLPDQDTILEDIRELIPLIRQAILAAWKRQQQNPLQNRVIHQPTTSAGEMVDYMVYEAQILLAGNPRVYFRDEEETWLAIDQRYDLRFKKLSSVGRPANAETRRQRRITSQAWLPNFSPVRLNVGWNEDSEGEVRVLMSFPTGFGVVGWCVEIRDDGVYSLVGQPILPFDGGLPRYQPPSDPHDLTNVETENEPARRVRPRRTPVPDEDGVLKRRVRPAGEHEQPQDAENAPSARKSDE